MEDSKFDRLSEWISEHKSDKPKGWDAVVEEFCFCEKAPFKQLILGHYMLAKFA